MDLLLEAGAISQGLVFRQAPPLWLIILVILPVTLGLTAFFYRLGKETSPRIRAFLAALRMVVLLLVMALLMDPAWRTQVVEQRKTLTIVLVDVSASMGHKDDYATNPDIAQALREAAKLPAGQPLDTWSRLDLVKQVLDPPGDRFLSNLMKKNDLRIYSFGEVLSSIAGLDDLQPRDRVTAIGQALEHILDDPDVKSRPVGGIVLITDGKNTAPPLPDAAAAIAARRKIPLHTVGVGDPKALKDMELVTVNAPSVVLVDDTMVIDVRLRQHGFDRSQITLQVLENGAPLLLEAPRTSVTLEATRNDQSFQIRYRPRREGTMRWVVEARPLPGEFDKSNNRKTIEVSVRRERLRVLYVEGFPRWEYRKLKDFLTRAQDAFETQCFLTSAQQGFPQESSRKLPPLTRFPDTEEELFRYDAIIFGDVDPRKIAEVRGRTQHVLELIRKFVDNGGGFAMIAGDRFSPRAYKDTPIEDLIPVAITSESSATSTTSPRGFRIRLTELGSLDPIMQLVEDPKRNREVWQGRDPTFQIPRTWWFAAMDKIKPGARVLAVHETAMGPQGPYPIFIASNYGDGPLFFSAVDETWRMYKWQGPVLFHRFWGNVVRHLARTRLFAGDKRYRLVSNRSEYGVGDQITLTAFVKDRSFRAEMKPTQEVSLHRPGPSGGEDLQLSLQRRDPGVYEKIFLAQKVGDYEAWIASTDGLSDKKLAPMGFRVVVSDVERREPILDETLLRSLSSKTDGRYVLLQDSRKLLAEISSGTVEIPRQQQFTSLRDRSHGWLWALPLAFVGLLATEWFLRKRFRLL